MSHPMTAPGGWDLDIVIYDDQNAGIAVSLMTDKRQHQKLAIRWLPTIYQRKDGTPYTEPGWMGDETSWFILPLDFGTAVGKCLLEKKVAGLEGFDPKGFEMLVKWLIDNQAVFDGFNY